MDGRNSLGCRISLLNASDQAIPTKSIISSAPTDLPYRALRSPPSRQSSYSSTLSSRSPPTPRLVRSDSSDSAAMQTPSPQTPNFSFEGIPAVVQAIPSFGDASFLTVDNKDPLLSYSSAPKQTAGGLLPYSSVSAAISSASHQQQQQQQPPLYRASSNSKDERQAALPKSKKNSYPCPLAKQFGCGDHFTTSGHAARHAKKHTGKKDAHCPECNKAFTRKDNMEQHRRTHQSGRSAKSPTDDSRAKKAKQQHQTHESSPHMDKSTARRPQLSPIQSTFTESSLPLSPLSPASTFRLTPPLTQTESFAGADFSRSTYPDPTQFAHPHLSSSYDMLSPSYALDALAMAASGEKRKYDSRGI